MNLACRLPMAMSATRGVSACVIALLLAQLSNGVAYAQSHRMLAYQATEVLAANEYGSVMASGIGADGLLYVATHHDVLVALDWRRGLVRRIDLGDSDERILRLGWFGDSIWVHRGSSLLLVGPDLNRVREVPLDLPGRVGELYSFRLLAVTGSNRAVVQTTASLQAQVPAGEMRRIIEEKLRVSYPGPVSELPVWVTDFENSELDTLMLLSTRNFVDVATSNLDVEIATADSFVVKEQLILQPFGDYPLVASAADGSVLVVVDRVIDGEAAPVFTLHWINAGGDTIRSHPYEFTPIRMRSGWLRDAASRHSNGLALDSAEAVSRAMSALYSPPWLPSVSGLQVGGDGTVWLRRENVPGSNAVDWSIVSPNGAEIGSVRLSTTYDLLAVRGLEAWARYEDEDGDAQLWHIQVSQPSGGGGR